MFLSDRFKTRLSAALVLAKPLLATLPLLAVPTGVASTDQTA